MPASEQYRRQVALLVRTIPLVAAETCFALKGGTATLFDDAVEIDEHLTAQQPVHLFFRAWHSEASDV
jgi:hypothetical protein